MAGKKIIIGNWKMNPLLMKDAEKLLRDIAKNLSRIRRTEIIVCPPLLYIEKLRKTGRKIAIGAQDAFSGDTGPFTGEVSGDMLYLLGVRHVILGHSERRACGEANAEVNKKVKGALRAGLRPILCVGENTRDAEHNYFSVVKEQLEECLRGVSRNSISKVILAYEPVWAISTTPDRRDATPGDCHEMAIFMRKVLADKFGRDAARVRILYGGSVNDRDAEDFLGKGGVDGLLVGRASLDAKKFAKIITIAETFS